MTTITLLLCVTSLWCTPPPAYVVQVASGDHDRRQTITSFTLPDEVDGAAFQLRSDDDKVIPIQVDENRTAWFILDHLDAGQTRTYHLDAVDSRYTTSSIEQRGEQAVHFSRNGQPVVTYHAVETALPNDDVAPLFRRGGYLHPVYTPAGRVLTDDYPSIHLHHHGIWASWTNTVFQGRTPDFWNMGNGTGTVKVDTLAHAWEGPVQGGLRARHRYIDLTSDEPVTALHEQWELRVYDVPTPDHPYYVFDLNLTQTTATDSALVLPEYHYGGVGFRGRGEWNGAANTTFLTSEGNDRSNGHATRARWCHIGGEVDGAPIGIAILGHPDNYEAPQPMRIHPDEPFFNFAPSQAGDWSIVPGTPYVARYRFVTYDGLPDPHTLDRLWNDYADPPVVRVVRR